MPDLTRYDTANTPEPHRSPAAVKAECKDRGHIVAEKADAPEREDELDTELETDLVDGEVETEAEDLDDEPSDEGDDELEISFDGEAAPASNENSTDLVRHLRAEIRKRDEELAKRGAAQAPAEAVIEVGEKPTLESCDYDGDKFETELDAWKERDRLAKQAQAKAQERTQAEQASYLEDVRTYETKKTALKARDFDVAEGAVLASTSPIQQAILIKAADDSAKVIYALGKHPGKLKELAAIEDPIKFAKAVVKLEGQLKVTQRTRTQIEPDTPIRGSAPLAKGSDKKLERLEQAAARTGDRTEVVRYKRELKAAQGKS